MPHPGWYASGWVLGMMIFMIVVWVVVAIGIIWAVRWMAASAGMPKPDESPLDILKKRYARGEITHEEYEEVRRRLKDDDEG